MHRTARQFEIDGLESGCRPSDGPKMPLCFLNEMKQRVALPISLGQSRREPALERGKRGDQMTPMVNRARRRAHASETVRGFAKAFARGFHGFVVDERAFVGDRSLQQEA